MRDKPVFMAVKCCDDNKWIKPREGGGWRCTNCNTIFDEYGRPVGGYTSEQYVYNQELKYGKPRFAS